MTAFRKFIENYTELPDADWQKIEQAFERNEFAKNEMILAEGNICRYFYFLEQGMVRFYVYHDGEESTKFFTAAPHCFTSKNSFREQKPAEENIQALEKSVVWQTSRKQANELLELKSWNTFTRKLIHEVQSFTEELMQDIKTKTAEQRYEELLKKYPEQVKRIPLKHLSGYLGIAPQSLSRIRKTL